MTESASWLRPVLARPAFWLVASAAALGTLALVGLPTVLIPNPLFARMTPVRPADYAFWIASGLLAGLTLAAASARATGVPPLCPTGAGSGRVTVGGLLTLFAVGCPTCNKLALLVLGATGAVTYFAPLQPLLGIASVALLGTTLYARLNGLRLAQRAVAAGPGASVATPLGLTATASAPAAGGESFAA